MAFIAGSVLATSGVAMQAVFRNPLADPFILGISAGAAVGAMVAALISLNVYIISLSAFAFSVLTVFVVYELSKVGGRPTSESLLLAGLAANFFLYSLEWLMLVTFNKTHLILTWLVGYLGDVEWVDVKVCLIPAILGVLAIYAFSRDLNVMTFGEEQARYLGVDVDRAFKITVAVSALITSVCTAFTGIIGFVGLMVPHMMRSVFGSDHRILIPSSAIFGGVFLVWADTIARTVFSDTVPVGIITMLCGAPFFIYLLRKTKRFN